MIQKLKSLFTKIVIVSLFAVPVMTPVMVSAATSSVGGNIQCGVDLNASQVSDSSACKTDSSSGSSINNILKLVINLFSLVVGVISVIMIIIGGLKYILSGGNDTNIAGAKNTILYAIIGLVVVALAQIIVRFVLNRVTTAV